VVPFAALGMVLSVVGGLHEKAHTEKAPQ